MIPDPTTTQPLYIDSDIWVPQPLQEEEEEWGPAHLNAFLVEDNPEIRAMIVEAMEDMAPVKFVGLATNEDSARLWLGANYGYWDIAIIDLMLDQGTGYGVLRDCRNRSDMQKTVVLTSFLDEQIRQRCLELGADEVFDKAHDIAKLVNYCKVHATYVDFMRESGIAPRSTD